MEEGANDYAGEETLFNGGIASIYQHKKFYRFIYQNHWESAIHQFDCEVARRLRVAEGIPSKYVNLKDIITYIFPTKGEQGEMLPFLLTLSY